MRGTGSSSFLARCAGGIASAIAVVGCGPDPCEEGFGRAADGLCYPLEVEETGCPPSSEDSGTPQADTGDSDPWSTPGYWSRSGPLDTLLEADTIPDSDHWEVWWAPSSDGSRWDEEPRWLAHSFFDLHVQQVEDALVITGRVDPDTAPEGVDTEQSVVAALTTEDLEQFGTHAWSLEEDGDPVPTGPALVASEEGTWQVLYVPVSPEEAAEPEAAEGQLRVYRAVRDGERFVPEADPVTWSEGIADPAPCATSSLHYLYLDSHDTAYDTATSDGILQATSTHGDVFELGETPAWVDYEDPFCRVEDDRVQLLALPAGGDGPPERRILDDEGQLGEAEVLLEGVETAGERLATPGLVQHGDQWILVWAAWVGS